MHNKTWRRQLIYFDWNYQVSKLTKELINNLRYKLAHVLARQAVVFADTDVWMEDLPRDLDDVLLFDFSY